MDPVWYWNLTEMNEGIHCSEILASNSSGCEYIFLRFAWGLIYIPNNDPRICLTINQCVFLGESTGARTTGGIIYHWPKWIQGIFGELDSLHVNLLYYPPSNFQANITTYRETQGPSFCRGYWQGGYYTTVLWTLTWNSPKMGNSITPVHLDGWLEGSTLSSWVFIYRLIEGRG